MPALMTGPVSRVILVLPWSKVIEIVPLTPSGAQVISKGLPAGTSSSAEGVIMLSKNWQDARDANSARTVADVNERRMMEVID